MRYEYLTMTDALIYERGCLAYTDEDGAIVPSRPVAGDGDEWELVSTTANGSTLFGTWRRLAR